MASTLKVAVIGAGLAGIAAARRLREWGIRVTVLEKSRGYGGRCASKRWEGQVIDHGAQYFTVRDAGFQAALKEGCGPRLKMLSAPILAGSGERLKGGSRFYHSGGNSRVAHDLAGDLEVRTGNPVEKAEPDGKGWSISGEHFDHILSTAPLPQTRKIAGLDPGESDYIPCLALLLLYEGRGKGPCHAVYAFSDPFHSLAGWTACENHKEGRIEAHKTGIVVHGSEPFSRKWLEADPEEWTPLLREYAESRWDLAGTRLLAFHPHRWRYARVEKAAVPPELPRGFYFGGDALSESRVESAWLAGRRAAEQIVV